MEIQEKTGKPRNDTSPGKHNIGAKLFKYGGQ